MDLTFITECRFYKTAEGKFYADDMSYSNSLWERYLKVFDNIFVVARVFDTNETFDAALLVDNVVFCAVFPFEGIAAFGKNYFKIKNEISKYISKDFVVIIRGGGALGFLASSIAKSKSTKYGVEVIGDPYDVFAPGVIQHPLRPLLRQLFTYFQKQVVIAASAVIYVTKNRLQVRYPASEKAFVTFASDVFLNPENLLSEPKKFEVGEVLHLISVGSLNQMYKSPDVLIRAIQILVNKGVKVKLSWLGNGKYQHEMENLARHLAIEENILFLGAVSAEEVTRQLDGADIFLLVSRTEGLPRAAVEAMSRGLPCIGTNVGGIPELLHKEALVEPESPEQISAMIERFVNNTDFASRQAAINLETSKEYFFEVLDLKRNDFYSFLKSNHDK